MVYFYAFSMHPQCDMSDRCDDVCCVLGDELKANYPCCQNLLKLLLVQYDGAIHEKEYRPAYTPQ